MLLEHPRPLNFMHIYIPEYFSESYSSIHLYPTAQIRALISICLDYFMTSYTVSLPLVLLL